MHEITASNSPSVYGSASALASRQSMSRPPAVAAARPRSLADDLRSRSDDDLAALLAAADDNVRGRLQGVFIVVVAGGPRIADVLLRLGSVSWSMGRYDDAEPYYRGALEVAGQDVAQQRMAILANTPGSDGVRLQGGAQGARAILVAGQPLREPIAQYGPFVMNNQQQIVQAVEDYRAGRLA